VLIGISLSVSPRPFLSWHAKYHTGRIRVRDIVNVVQRRDKVLKRTETRGAYRADSPDSFARAVSQTRANGSTRVSSLEISKTKLFGERNSTRD